MMSYRRLLNVILAALLLLTLLPHAAPAYGEQIALALPGDASAWRDNTPPITVASSINGIQVGFAQEFGKTTIWLRICSDAPHFQLRSEMLGNWITEVFHRTDASEGCSPSPRSWWRMVYNIDPVPGAVFRIYGTANETVLPEAEFMQRASRVECVVTAYGAGACTPGDPRFSALRGAIEEPAAGAAIQGSARVRGWAVDAGSWVGTSITKVQVLVNGVDVGVASYGEPRADVAAALGDSRFVGSEYRLMVDTTRFPNGPATIQVHYHSALPGMPVAILERQVVIDNPSVNLPPNPPVLVEPAPGATVTSPGVTLRVQDAGDPDNGPRPSRDYLYRIGKADGSWSVESGWIAAVSWDVTLPGPGAYRWEVMAGDGSAGSAWAGPRDLIYSPPPAPDTILNVRYVDQVFAQRYPLNGWWVYCGPATLAMLLHYYGVERRDVFSDRAPTAELARELGVGGAGTPGGTIPAALSRRGLHSVQETLSAEQIRASLAAGHPVLISTSRPNHISLIIGVRANGTFVVHDPMGGRFWSSWSPTANRNDVPWRMPFDTPRTRGATLPDQGVYVEYSYDEFVDMGIKYMLRVTGPAPLPQATSAAVNTAGDTFTGEGVRLSFGSGEAAPASDGMIRLTHTPQHAPARPIDGYSNPLAAFHISAFDRDQQPLTRLRQPFTIEVDIDPLFFETWGERSGSSASADSTGSPGTVPRPIADALVLAIWDAKARAWVELPTRLDVAGRQVIARSDRFGEFAVLTRSDLYTVFLPALAR